MRIITTASVSNTAMHRDVIDFFALICTQNILSSPEKHFSELFDHFLNDPSAD